MLEGVGTGEEGSLVLGTDWWNVESWGVWGQTRSTLWMMPPASDNESYRLTVFARAFPPNPVSYQRVTVYVDGKLTTVWDVQASEGEFSVAVQRSRGHAVKVEFVVEKPVSPHDIGVSADTRVLGLGLSKFRLDLL